jgi:hypothetical protein
MFSLRRSASVLAAAIVAAGALIWADISNRFIKHHALIDDTLSWVLVFIPLALAWVIACALRPHWRPSRIIALLGALGIGLGVAGYLLIAGPRRENRDKAVATRQIAWNVDQFFRQNPTRVFANYDDVIGPSALLPEVDSVDGEDYRELFPLRVDWKLLSVTMGDGRKNIMLRDYEIVRLSPRGEILGAEQPDRAAAAARYQALLALRKTLVGVYVSKAPAEGRFETTWAAGVPDGPFRATYADGKLWAEATYVRGAPVGRHVVYDRAGKIIYETVFVPWRRGH